MAVKFCVCRLKDNVGLLLKETPSTVNSWVLVIFSRGGGTEVIFLLLWWIIISLSFLTITHDLRLRQTKLFFSPFTSVHSASMRSVHGTVSIKVYRLKI